LSPDDQSTLFAAVPYTTLSLASTGGEEGIAEQENQVLALKKILDLRNASKPGIEVVNRQRIIEAFGRRRVMSEDGEVGWEGEPQSGGSEVQGTSFCPFFFVLILYPYHLTYTILPNSILSR
jgi:hypothetical protein